MHDVDLIKGMNRDLAQELGTISRTIQQTAMARGSADCDLRVFLKVGVIDDVFHALFLAEKIVDLGGTPTCTPAPFKSTTDPKEMLEYDLELERHIIGHYEERIKQAEAVWALGLKTRLEKILADEAEHAKAILRLLARRVRTRAAG